MRDPQIEAPAKRNLTSLRETIPAAPTPQVINLQEDQDFSQPNTIAANESRRLNRELADAQATKQQADAFLASGVSSDGRPVTGRPWLGATFASKAVDAAQDRVATYQERAAKPLHEYPTLAKAVLETPGLTAADVKRVVNFAAAWTAADRMEQYAHDPVAQANILLTMPNDLQRAATLDILQAKWDAAQEQIAGNVDENSSLAAKAGQALGGAASFLMDEVVVPINEIGQRAGRAFTYNVQEKGLLAATLGRDGWFDNWDKVENTPTGNYNPTVINQLKSEYGAAPVDLIIELQTLQRQGDESPISTLLMKYSTDPEKATILQDLIYNYPKPERKADAEKWRLLEAQVNSANQGDLGQMVSTTNPLGGVAPIVGVGEDGWRGSTGQKVTGNVAGVAGTFALDPTIFLTKVRAGYLAARYALRGLAPGEDVAKILSKPGVVSYLDSLGRDIGRYADAGDAAAKASIRQTIAKRYGTYFPEDVLSDLVSANVRSAEDFVQFVDDSNKALLIAQGKAAKAAALPGATVDELLAPERLEQGSVYSRMLDAQKARRGEPLLPRDTLPLSAAGQIVAPAKIRRLLSDVVKSGRGSVGFKEYDELIAGLNEPGKSLGQILNEQAGVIGARERDVLSRPFDKAARFFSTTVGSPVIYIKDARDTQKFYKFARLFVSKGMAVRLADDWRVASEAERRLMWTGIVRTAASARGFEQVADETVKRYGDKMKVGDLVRELVTGTRAGEKYGPDTRVLRIDDTGALDPDGAATIPLEEYLLNRYSAGKAVAPEEMRQILDSVVDDTPSKFNGRESALHLDQTSDYLAVPNLNDIALITKRAKFMQRVLGTPQFLSMQQVTDWWSIVNLAAPRYSVRNSIEDWFLYAITGGKFRDAVKGRAISTGIRETREQKLGFFNKRLRKLGDAQPFDFAERIILPGLDEGEIGMARQAAAAGDMSVLRDLAVKSVIRQKIGKTLSDADEKYLADFVSSQAGFSTLDELTELAHHLNQGTFPQMQLADDAISDGEALVVYPQGKYENIAMTGSGWTQYALWQRAIDRFVTKDGSIGRIALLNLDNPEVARQKIVAEIIRDANLPAKDPKRVGYLDKFTGIYDANAGGSPEAFAARYVQDALNTFSGRDGRLNNDLLSRVRVLDSTLPEGGYVITKTKVATTKIDPTTGKPIISEVPSVTINNLQKYRGDALPRYILGRRTEDDPFRIPVSLQERIFDWMGNGVARLSKEPIYFANYLSARKQLAPYEEALAARIGEEAAARITTKQALDRAMGLTLSYTDNPANQSMLAWRMRNFARYYRATEDFYRRAYRAVRFDPSVVYKTFLTVHALDESGFVYSDENGDRYFIYPGSGITNDLVGRVMALFGGNGVYVPDMPLLFSGKLKMIAPSFDPVAAVPTLSSPVSAILVKSVINVVPAFKGIEQALLGDIAEGNPIAQTALPAPAMRLFNLLSQDERESAYAGAFMGAVQVLEAAGKMPELTADEADVEAAQKAVATVATNILGTRFALGFFYPASPQVEQNDVTDVARKYGIPNMRAEFLALLNKYEVAGHPDAQGAAMADWIRTFGLEAAPYTVGKTEKQQGLRSLPSIKRGEETLRWVQDNEEVVRKFPAAAMFFTPQVSSGFSYDTARYLREAGFTVPKSASKFFQDVRMAEAKYVYFTSKDAAEAEFAAARTEDEQRAVKDKWDYVKAGIYADYPGLADAMKSGAMSNQEAAERMLDGYTMSDGTVKPGEIRRAVDWFYEQGGQVPKQVEEIARAIATWDYYKPQLDQLKGQTTVAAIRSRDQIKGDLRTSLLQIAENDPSADMFIRRIMFPILKLRFDGTESPF